MKGPTYSVYVKFDDGIGADEEQVVFANITGAQAHRLEELLREHKKAYKLVDFNVSRIDDNVLSLAGLQGWLNRNGLNAPR